MKKIRKIALCVVVCLSMFLPFVTSVYASSGYDTFDNIKEQIPTSDKYFIHFKAINSSSPNVLYDEYYFSSEPLVFDNNNYCHSVGSKISQIYVDGKLTNSFSNPNIWYFSFNSTIYVHLYIDYTILDSNYDVKDVDGNILFKPGDSSDNPPQYVPTDMSLWETLDSVFRPILMAVIGGMVLLMCCLLLLKRLPTWFRRWSHLS